MALTARALTAMGPTVIERSTLNFTQTRDISQFKVERQSTQLCFPVPPAAAPPPPKFPSNPALPARPGRRFALREPAPWAQGHRGRRPWQGTSRRPRRLVPPALVPLVVAPSGVAVGRLSRCRPAGPLGTGRSGGPVVTFGVFPFLGDGRPPSATASPRPRPRHSRPRDSRLPRRRRRPLRPRRRRRSHPPRTPPRRRWAGLRLPCPRSRSRLRRTAPRCRGRRLNCRSSAALRTLRFGRRLSGAVLFGACSALQACSFQALSLQT